MQFRVRPGSISNCSSRFSQAATDAVRCAVLLPDSGPHLQVLRLQGGRAVNNKRELFPGPSPAPPLHSVTLPAAAAQSRLENVDLIPFSIHSMHCTIDTGLPAPSVS